MNCFGNAVAKTTTIAVTAGRMPPGIAKNFVIKLPSLQMAKDTARAVADCNKGSLSPDSNFASSSTSEYEMIISYYKCCACVCMRISQLAKS